MENFRPIQNIYTAEEITMGETRLRQAIPLPEAEQVSPFILLHHFDTFVEPGDHSFNVPAHPHRGFCPITFMFEGSIEHNDSLGNNEVIHDNEVQWINAGRGLIHSEKASKEFVEKGGRYRGIQLWVNLPKTEKMKTPSYQPITKDKVILIEENGVEFRLVSGLYAGKKGPAKSSILTAMIRMKANSEFKFFLPIADNVLLYILEGDLLINLDQTASQYNLIVFDNAEGHMLLKATSDAVMLLMSGEPIDEPLVTHGPFVMNTQTEILEAMRDYQDGKMGYLY